jgi:NhaC family Na+:H+ antiporter
MVWSATPAWLIGLFIYFLVGLRYGSEKVESPDMAIITQTIKENFNFNILLLLPLVIVFYFAFSKKPTIPGMLISSFVAGIMAIIFQKASITDIATAMNTGYQAHTGVEQVDKLISQGGMMSMMEVQLVAFTAFSFGGILLRTGLLSVILDRVMRFTRKVWSLVLTTIGSSIVVALATGSSYLSMILPGDLLSPVYKKRGLAAKNLSRIIEESGAIIVPLIPYSMAGVYITGILRVPTLSYAPWAIMNYASVVILAIYGFTKFTMAPKIRDDETQIGS